MAEKPRRRPFRGRRRADNLGVRACAGGAKGREVCLPLQNRVDPFGAIHAVPERGMFTGNRGVIHDPDRRGLLARRWTTKAWIVCRCDFGERRRAVMARNAPAGSAGWTELFFLDEVTALAAGHRPCFFCRRPAAAAFAGNFSQAFAALPRAPEIDRRLHVERLASGGRARPLAHRDISGLPDGAVVACGGEALALRGGRLLAWRFAGYGAPCAPHSRRGSFTLVTPPTTVAVLSAGYRPVWHESAGT